MLQKLNTRRAGFTLVEIMIVVAIIALLAAIAVPNFLRSRKRSQATAILEDLRLIDSAMDQYSLETNRAAGTGFACHWDDIQRYLKTDSRAYASGGNDILGNPFGGNDRTNPGSGNVGLFYVDGDVLFSATSYNALSDVAPASFWSPFRSY